MKTSGAVTVLLLALSAALGPLVADAFQTELLSSYPLQGLPHLLGLYTELHDAISFQASSSSSSLQPASTGSTPLKSPEEAFIRLMQYSNSYQEFHVGLRDPLKSTPASSEEKLQVTHQRLCPTLSTGFAQYPDETLSERVLYEELAVDDDEQLFDKRRWDERTLESATKFFTRVQMELRLMTASEEEEVDEALDTLFTECVVAPLLKDMVENTS